MAIVNRQEIASLRRLRTIEPMLAVAHGSSVTLLREPRAATIRRTIVNVPARFARSARRITLHLPEAWPWQNAFDRDATPGTQPCPRHFTAGRSRRPGPPAAHRWIEA